MIQPHYYGIRYCIRIFNGENLVFSMSAQSFAQAYVISYLFVCDPILVIKIELEACDNIVESWCFSYEDFLSIQISIPIKFYYELFQWQRIQVIRYINNERAKFIDSLSPQ